MIKDFRTVITTILDKEADFRAVKGAATNGLDGIQAAEELRPDLILLEIGLPKLHGIEASRLIRKQAPQSKTVFLTAQTELDLVNAALDAGATGYIVKRISGATSCQQ